MHMGARRTTLQYSQVLHDEYREYQAYEKGDFMTSPAKSGKGGRGSARPIKSKRDYEQAMSITQRLLAHPNRDTEEEKRLKALLEEMDRFEEVDDEDGDDFSDDSLQGGPRRRWSDEGGDS